MIRPKLLALLCCDSAASLPGDRDGRLSLYGTFTRLAFRAFPARLPRMAVYTRWAFGEGEHPLGFRIVGGDGNVLCESPAGATLEFDDPLATREAVIAIDDLTFPAPGTFFVELTLDGERVDAEGTFFVDHA